METSGLVGCSFGHRAEKAAAEGGRCEQTKYVTGRHKNKHHARLGEVWNFLKSREWAMFVKKLDSRVSRPGSSSVWGKDIEGGLCLKILKVVN